MIESFPSMYKALNSTDITIDMHICIYLKFVYS